MKLLFGLMSLAVILEGVITYAKTFFVQHKFQWQMLGSVGVGIFVAVAYKADILSTFGLNSTIPFVGCVLTGILLSRGSNYIFDLIKKLTAIKGQAAPVVEIAGDTEITEEGEAI